MMLFAVAFSALLVLCTAPPSRIHRRGVTDCDVGGTVYKDGQFFTLPANPCLHYKCIRGGYQIEKWECKDSEGVCHPINSEIHIGCSIHQCRKEGHWANFVFVRKECRDEDGTCRPVGYHRVNRCRQQVCAFEDNVAFFKNVNKGAKMC